MAGDNILKQEVNILYPGKVHITIAPLGVVAVMRTRIMLFAERCREIGIPLNGYLSLGKSKVWKIFSKLWKYEYQ